MWNARRLTAVLCRVLAIVATAASVASGQALQTGEARDLPSLRQAAERGDPNAQFELGVRYAEGKGVAPDDKEAARWILKAAEQGHLEAQFNLGLMYADGNGVPLDESKAVEWLRKAAQKGSAQAQQILRDNGLNW